MLFLVIPPPHNFSHGILKDKGQQINSPDVCAKAGTDAEPLYKSISIPHEIWDHVLSNLPLHVLLKLKQTNRAWYVFLSRDHTDFWKKYLIHHIKYTATSLGLDIQAPFEILVQIHKSQHGAALIHSCYSLTNGKIVPLRTPTFSIPEIESNGAKIEKADLFTYLGHHYLCTQSENSYAKILRWKTLPERPDNWMPSAGNPLSSFCFQSSLTSTSVLFIAGRADGTVEIFEEEKGPPPKNDWQGFVSRCNYRGKKESAAISAITCSTEIDGVHFIFAGTQTGKVICLVYSSIKKEIVFSKEVQVNFTNVLLNSPITSLLFDPSEKTIYVHSKWKWKHRLFPLQIQPSNGKTKTPYLAVWKPPFPEKNVTDFASVAMDPTGKYLVAGSETGDLMVYQKHLFETQQQGWSPLPKHRENFNKKDGPIVDIKPVPTLDHEVAFDVSQASMPIGSIFRVNIDSGKASAEYPVK